MVAALTRVASLLQGVFWLTGPIFQKELRVSSRRRRNYVLRFGYIVALTIFMVTVWTITVGLSSLGGSSAFQVSRMPEAVKQVVPAIIWFQFIALQLIAVVMMSTSISDELYRGTLGVLMTTPISSTQIVLGKLFSKLLQMGLLLGISLPLLAIVRVFGGVPWDYVIWSQCVTITAAAFAGAISLFFSIYSRQAYSVILRTIFVCFLLYIAPVWAFALLRLSSGGMPLPPAGVMLINPFAVMFLNTQRMLNPIFSSVTLSEPLHCTIMTGATGLLLTLCALLVRRAGLRQITGQVGLFSTRKAHRAADTKGAAQGVLQEMAGSIRRVRGPAIIWKETRTPLIKGRITAKIGLFAGIAVLISAYASTAWKGYLKEIEVQIAFVAAYLGLGLFRTATAAATSITSEKETRTWPILLTTPLDGRQIILGKIAGSCLRSWPLWLLLAAHVIVFSCIGYINPLAIWPLFIVAISSALLVSSGGVFFSSCFKHTSTSATVNLILFFSFIAPFCCPLPTYFGSPLVIAAIIIGVTSSVEGWAVVPFGRDWFSQNSQGFFIGVSVLVGIVGVYLLIAFICFVIANSNVRRRIF